VAQRAVSRRQRLKFHDIVMDLSARLCRGKVRHAFVADNKRVVFADHDAAATRAFEILLQRRPAVVILLRAGERRNNGHQHHGKSAPHYVSHIKPSGFEPWRPAHSLPMIRNTSHEVSMVLRENLPSCQR
jgi:hypothetical protein